MAEQGTPAFDWASSIAAWLAEAKSLKGRHMRCRWALARVWGFGFVHSVNKLASSPHFVVRTVLGIEDTARDKAHVCPGLWELAAPWL